MNNKSHQITTASPEEVSHFSKLANQWWATEGAFWALHKINPIRIKFICDQICNHFGRKNNNLLPLKGIRVLDIGCGGGLLSEPLHELGAVITGIDASAENVKIAAHHAAKTGLDIEYLNTLPEELLLESSRFDVVLNMEVIEHVANLNSFMEISCSLIKPGGAMALSTINRSLKSFLIGKFGAEYILRWVPKGTHDWHKFVKPSELAHKLYQNGMELKQISGISFDLLHDSWKSTDDVSINYMAFAIKG